MDARAIELELASDIDASTEPFEPQGSPAMPTATDDRKVIPNLPPLNWKREIPKYRISRDTKPAPKERFRFEPPFSSGSESDVWQYGERVHKASEVIATTEWPNPGTMTPLNYSELEQIAIQADFHVYSKHRGSRGGRFGFGLSPSIERAKAMHVVEQPIAAKESSELDPPAAPTIHIFSGAEVTSYTELIVGIQQRIGELGIRQVDFDVLAGFAPGMTGKAFGPSQVKRLGPEKLFDAIRAAGLRLRLEADLEQLEKMRKQIAEHCQPRQGNQARMGNRSHPSNKIIDEVLTYLANKRGGMAVLNAAAKQARSNWARHAAKALWERKRGAGDFAAYAGNVSRISSVPALPPPEERSPNPCDAEANAA